MRYVIYAFIFCLHDSNKEKSMVIIYDNGSTYEIDEQQIYDPFPDVGDGQKEKEKDD